MTHLSSSFYDSPFHGFRCLHSAGETIFKFSSSLPGRRAKGERQEDWQEAAGIEREPPCVTNFSSTQHSSRVCLLLRAKGFCQSIRRKKKFVASNFLTPSILDPIMGTNNSWKNSLPSFFEPTILSPLIPIINGER